MQTGQEDTSGYAGYWEEKLEEALRCVEGVGKVRVLITLQCSEQKIVEKDGPEQNTDTEETDSTEEGALSGRAVSRRVRSIRRTDRGETYPMW